ncbi:MAG: hypothetical protein R2849_10940 [Thermomicrobiales bacterium]
MDLNRVILDVKHLKKYFPITKGFFQRTVGHVQAVDDITFDSIAGKPDLRRRIRLREEHGRARLLDPTDGVVRFGDRPADINGSEPKEMRRRMIIFQDPFSSLLNPRTVGSILAQPLKIHNIVPNKDVGDRVSELLERRRRPNPTHAERYPHELLGRPAARTRRPGHFRSSPTSSSPTSRSRRSMSRSRPRSST